MERNNLNFLFLQRRSHCPLSPHFLHLVKNKLLWIKLKDLWPWNLGLILLGDEQGRGRIIEFDILANSGTVCIRYYFLWRHQFTGSQELLQGSGFRNRFFVAEVAVDYSILLPHFDTLFHYLWRLKTLNLQLTQFRLHNISHRSLLRDLYITLSMKNGSWLFTKLV